jgi:predicted metal-dependent peptidase
MFNLNDHIFRLLQDEPFFASLSRNVDKTEDRNIPTAGVRIDPETGFFELLYNPDFFEGLETDKQRSGVLVHEFYHLVMEHIIGRLPDELSGIFEGQVDSKKQSLFKLYNIAADLSINCHIGRDNLPETGCFPGYGHFEDLPEYQTVEFYYAKLKEMAEQEEKDGNSEGGLGDMDSFDDHSQWGGKACDPATKEIAKQRLTEAVKKAADDASKVNSWGSVSASMKKEIMERITPVLDWRKVLRYFVKCSQRAEKRSTVKRLNKRYPYVHPGRKVRRQANIAISIDQSGSVSDSMLASFYAELNKLAEIATFTVVPFDTEVASDKVYQWRKGESRKRERVLYGGTCFDAPTEYVNAGGFDAHIVLTDMCAPKPKSSRCPRMWMTDAEAARRPYFKTNERVIAITK